MNHQNKKKLTNKDKQAIKGRYLVKLEEYKTKTMDELKDIFRNTKISSTDRHALIAATDILMQKDMDEITKVKMIEDNIEGE